jgi:cytochrome b561
MSSVKSGRYDRTAISLHWLVALLMAPTFYIGWIMTDIRGFTPEKLRYFSWHKWLGVTLFALAVARAIWRVTHRAPPLPAGIDGWQRTSAQLVHVLLYLLMFAIPLSGYLYSSASGIQVVFLGIWPLPVLIGPDTALKIVLRTLHVAFNYMLIAVLALHVLAVAKHMLFDRQNILARMLPFGTPHE